MCCAISKLDFRDGVLGACGEKVLDDGRKALPTSPVVLELQDSYVVPNAIAGLAGDRAEVEVAIHAGENRVAEDGERIEPEASVFHLIGRANVDGGRDIAAWRCLRRASPRLYDCDANEHEEECEERNEMSRMKRDHK